MSLHILQGRLAHGNHITFKGTSGDMAITLVTTGVEGALASDSTPLVAQIIITIIIIAITTTTIINNNDFDCVLTPKYKA